jgi:uncharacterized protein (DUF58 family)
MSAQPGKRRSLRSVLGSGNGSSRSLFFNRFWVTTAIAVSVLGVALDDRGITLLGILVAGSAGVTWGWNRVSLSRLRYSCTIAERRHFPGDATEVRVEIVNDKPLPVPWVSIDIELSDALRLPDRETTPSGITGRRNVQFRTRLGPYERVVWRIPVVCQARGLQTIGPATIRAGDPLGFFSNRIDLPEEASIIVYPRIARLPPFQLPPRHAVGDVRVPRQLLVDPLRVVGIRDYRPEDPFKAIHWKASARQGRLQVRVLEPTTSLQLAIFANIDTFEHYWEGLDVGASEQVIELAASLAVWGLDNRYAVSVASNGIVAGSDQAMRVPSGRNSRPIRRRHSSRSCTPDLGGSHMGRPWS